MITDAAPFARPQERFTVDIEDPVHVPGEVDDNAGADGVAGDRRAGSPAGHGNAGRPAHREGGQHVVHVKRLDDNSRQQPIITRVGRVLGSPAKPAGYCTADRFCKLGSDVARAIGYRRHADVVSKGDASSWQADGCG